MRWPSLRRPWSGRKITGADLSWIFDDMEADGAEAFARRVDETLTESPITAGWIINVQPERIEGYAGVSLWVVLLGVGGRVSGRRIWIEMSGVQDLLNVADRIRSPEFREAMGDFGDSYN